MPANTAPIYSATPKAQWGEISAANTAKDGTGTVVTVFTAGAEGSFIKKIRVKALGTNVATVMRLFLNNGGSSATPANNSLVADVTLPATTTSEVAGIPDYELAINEAIPAGYVLNITLGTAVAAGYAVTVFAGDY